ncbi:MAG: sugar phosphate nucleotidyltransferase [Mariprofundaceae bacterium]|nr:sugar phosphate nucleotidyltransferase [Mariprofundaceae bacterium]
MNKRTDQGIILAAGLGTRLNWLTRTRPKALMPIAGVPVIIWVIRRMVAAGIRHIAINIHHHADLLQSTLGDGEKFGVRLYYSIEQHLLDSGGGAHQAMLCLPSVSPVLVHNADIVSSIDLHALQQKNAACVLAVVKNPPHHATGDFTLQQGLLGLNHGLRYTFSGVSYWQPELILSGRLGTRFSLLQSIHAQIHRGKCAGFFHPGSWFDIGRPADWIQASKYASTA